jgi:GntR family transcriptional regulator, sialic acid-inducible nan operon repressor
MSDQESPIIRRKLSDAVLERLLTMIDSGQIQPGDQFPSERELMARYRVGRPAVREALQTLKNMGMVDIHHGERARLNGLTPHSLLDLIDRSTRHLLRTCPKTLESLSEARLFFEIGMVRLAVKRGTEEDIQRLGEKMERLRSGAGDREAFVKADMAFHIAIASFCGNPLYTALSEFLLMWLFEHHPQMVAAPGAEEVTIAEHQALFENIIARNEEGAVRTITDHLTRANPRYRQYIEQVRTPVETRSGAKGT